jgi:serine/threonine protein kinase
MEGTLVAGLSRYYCTCFRYLYTKCIDARSYGYVVMLLGNAEKSRRSKDDDHMHVYCISRSSSGCDSIARERCVAGNCMQVDGDERGFRAKISDFGLSHYIAHGQSDTVEVSMGTEAYLSPEAMRDFAITRHSDVYALGLVMWEVYHGVFWHAAWDAERCKRCVVDQVIPWHL